MRRFVGTILRKCRLLRVREDGTATIEFVIIFPVVVTLLVGSLEIGFYMARTAFLDRSLEMNIRELRLGNLEPATHAQLAQQICEDANFSGDCPNEVLIELQPISTDDWNIPTSSISCVNRVDDIQPVVTFEVGQEDEIMLVRACVVIEPIFGTTGYALGLPKEEGGGFLISAASTFVNEP